ncbi:hypothetical protein OK074_4709 [Actinobacteria bacterium OK074]|nr:hypothetical protein OK074_4709 [Actinobacteria bacterium OK074]
MKTSPPATDDEVGLPTDSIGPLKLGDLPSRCWVECRTCREGVQALGAGYGAHVWAQEHQGTHIGHDGFRVVLTALFSLSLKPGPTL